MRIWSDEKPKLRTIAVDFDGVIHQYNLPWINAHTIPDPPVPGAIVWLQRMVQHFNVVIFSTRATTWRGRWAMRAWLKAQAGNLFWESQGIRGLEEIKFTAKKPIALIYIDDRGWRFNGSNFPTSQEIHDARPWNKPKRNGSTY